MREITLPDIGDFETAEIIDIPVKAGDRIAAEDTLLTLESDKATMDIPAPCPGVIDKLLVKVGDSIGMGAPIMRVIAEVAEGDRKETAPETVPETAQPQVATATDTSATANMEENTEEAGVIAEIEPPPVSSAPVPVPVPVPANTMPSPPQAPLGAQTVHNHSTRAHASPSVRHFARKLGVDLGLVYGSGRNGRITKEDVQAFTKSVMSGNKVSASGGFALPEIPPVDFSKYGHISSTSLSRLKLRSGANLHRNWITIPHITQFDEADITELEATRKTNQAAVTEQHGTRLTMLSFLVKAVTHLLQEKPDFNSSLHADGSSLVLKHYYHIGIAVNTPQGLTVPVIKDTDKKSIIEIAQEIGHLSTKARENKLPPRDLQGGCFTISSLGAIGGGHFTPIINAPEVAILGVSRAQKRPRWDEVKESFMPRLVLPFALSYDHRVIDGVAGAEFSQGLVKILEDGFPKHTWGWGGSGNGVEA